MSSMPFCKTSSFHWLHGLWSLYPQSALEADRGLHQTPCRCCRSIPYKQPSRNNLPIKLFTIDSYLFLYDIPAEYTAFQSGDECLIMKLFIINPHYKEIFGKCY